MTRKVAAVVTFWHAGQGGYWEANAYHMTGPEYGQPIRKPINDKHSTSLYRTAVDEMPLALAVALKLEMMGYDVIRFYTSEPPPRATRIWITTHPEPEVGLFCSDVSGQNIKRIDP